MSSPAGRVARGRWARASRRRSPGPTPTATATPSRPANADRREMLAFCEVVRGPPGHHPRVHHQRLPRHLLRRGDRPDGGHDHHRPAPAQLEPAHRRLADPGEDRPPARGLGPGRRGGRADRRPDHADPGADEHELPHPLRPVPHPRLGRRDGPARPRSGSRSCATRRSGPQLDELAHSKDAGVFRRLSHWANYIIGDTFAEANEGLSWRDVGSIAEEQGKEPFDALLDIVIADDLRTVLWPKASDGDDASWAGPGRRLGRPGGHGRRLRRRGPPRPDVRLQLPDVVPRRLPAQAQAGPAGAGRPDDDPGTRPSSSAWRDRGRVAEGLQADLFVFDPETVGSEPATLVDDLPGRQPPPHRRRHRRGPGAGQRGRDHRRRQAHRQPARAPCCGRAGTPSPSTRPVAPA